MGHKEGAEQNIPEYMRLLPRGDRTRIIRECVGDSKINVAHLFLSEFIRRGLVDRIFTTNFDPLTIKATALLNIYPSVYDVTSSVNSVPARVSSPAIFFLHGQANGILL